jgi:hypothetical protein
MMKEYVISPSDKSHPKRVHDTKKVADREAREHRFEDGTNSVSRGDAAISGLFLLLDRLDHDNDYPLSPALYVSDDFMRKSFIRHYYST